MVQYWQLVALWQPGNRSLSLKPCVFVEREEKDWKLEGEVSIVQL